MPAAASSPDRRPPAAAIVAAVLALPTAYALLALGNAALTIAGGRPDGGPATWLILIITFGWTAGLLVGAVRLLLGRAWWGVAAGAGAVAVLLTVGVVVGGFGGSGLLFTGVAWVASVGTTVLACLPGVRRWVAGRRRDRLFPGSAQRAPSRP